MNEEEKQRLQALRDSVLDELGGMGDYFANSEEVSYEVLLTLARNTGNTALLDKTFEKIKAIDDPEQKSNALLELLDEVEVTLADDIEEDSDEEAPAQAEVGVPEEPEQPESQPQPIEEEQSHEHHDDQSNSN